MYSDQDREIAAKQRTSESLVSMFQIRSFHDFVRFGDLSIARVARKLLRVESLFPAQLTS